MPPYSRLIPLGAALLLATPALSAVEDWSHVSNLEAQRPEAWRNPIYIDAVYQTPQGGVLVVYAETATRSDPRPSGQSYSPDGKKALLHLKAPAFLARYMALNTFNLSDIELGPVLYSTHDEPTVAYQPAEWSHSPFLGWVYMPHYPWVYQLETREWLYFGWQAYSMRIYFEEPTEAKPLPSWFQPYPESDGNFYRDAIDFIFDSVAFHFWSSRRGWLVTDANLYPYCWSRAIEAWMLHRRGRIHSSLDAFLD